MTADSQSAQSGPSVRVEEPHDPANGLTSKREGNPCNRGCPGDWPCEVRKQQRADLKECVSYLLSDLYKRVPLVEEKTGGRWESPLGWVVWLGYAERGLVGTILDHTGSLHSAATNANVQWLEADLP